MPFNFLSHRIKPTELAAKEGPGKPGIFAGLYGRDYIRKRQQMSPQKVQTSALLKRRV